MKDPITLNLNQAAIGKVLANHFANSVGLLGPWKVTFTVEDGRLTGATVEVSAS